ncbi:MAG: hypothetical protein M3145_12670, partial [Pseudomonadota bacterium]|nr:hypothetical protein [Pseudomonadota bacterium]
GHARRARGGRMDGLEIAPVVCLIGRRRHERTGRRIVDGYWRRHALRADRLARALATDTGAPEGWSWQPDTSSRTAAALGFRRPPLPYLNEPHRPAKGRCVVCGRPIFRFGWHCDLWGDGQPNTRASWHACCVVAYRLWIMPSEFLKPLAARQRRLCPITGERLRGAGEVDHRIPLFRVWREFRGTAWPDVLGFWGAPNLQVLSRTAHREKCAREARDRRMTASLEPV